MLGFARIADLSVASDGKSKFTVYNIHMNSIYHCSLRYSQLLEFHSELKVNFDTTHLEEFPPKHWLGSLNEYQQAQRRVMLERFIQSVCQNRVIGPSEMVKEYWLGAQRACSELVTPSGEIDVYLVNGKKVSLTVQLSDRADQLLEQVGAHIELNSDLTYYFGLFLERESDNVVVCPLTEYQSPLITLHTANSGSTVHRITLRQHFWDPVFAPPLLEDKVAKNMLYIEALASVARGHIDLTADVKEKLTALKSKGQKKEYLECMFEQAQFGYRQIEGFTFDHPVEGMEGCVRVGKQEVVTYTHHGAGVWAQCQRYPIIRIRSWKVGFDSKAKVPWLQINFQLSKDEFVWVHLCGEHSVFLNLCLHSAVSELLRARAKTPLRTPSSQPIQRTMRELPRFAIVQAPLPSSLESSGSEGQRSTDDLPATSDSTDGPPPGTSQIERSSSSSSDVVGSSAYSRDHRRTSESGAKASKKPAGRRGSKSKKVKSPTETENATFNFGTDDDL